MCINYHKHISTCLFIHYRYHLVLENGLPDWRQPIYYYRRVRKMGLAEFFAVIFVITTVGQYIVMWAVYAERKFTLVRYLYNVLCSIYTELAKFIMIVICILYIKKRTIYVLTSKFMLIYFLKMIYKNSLISTSEQKSRHCYKLTICFVMILCLRFFVIFLLHRTH